MCLTHKRCTDSASPPLCIGLYAKWGAGKSFMIQLIKQQFDPTAQEMSGSYSIVQWFEADYELLSDIPHLERAEQFCRFLNCSLEWLPVDNYTVSTINRLMCDAFNDTCYFCFKSCPSESFSKCWNWFCDLRRVSTQATLDDVVI